MRVYEKTIPCCGTAGGCPNFIRYATCEGPAYMCHATPDGRSIDMPLSTAFPEWCPLPKAKS